MRPQFPDDEMRDDTHNGAPEVPAGDRAVELKDEGAALDDGRMERSVITTDDMVPSADDGRRAMDDAPQPSLEPSEGTDDGSEETTDNKPQTTVDIEDMPPVEHAVGTTNGNGDELPRAAHLELADVPSTTLSTEPATTEAVVAAEGKPDEGELTKKRRRITLLGKNGILTALWRYKGLAGSALFLMLALVALATGGAFFAIELAAAAMFMAVYFTLAYWFPDSWIWKSKGLWMGAIALGLALYGQKLVTEDKLYVHAIRWYALGIILMLFAWGGTYKNKSSLAVPAPKETAPATTLLTRRRTTERDAQTTGFWHSIRSRVPFLRQDISEPDTTKPLGRLRVRWRGLVKRYPVIMMPWPRYLIAFVALGMNLWAAQKIRENFFSVEGGWVWIASMIVLVAAFLGERHKPTHDLDAGVEEVEERHDTRLTRRQEIAIVAAIILVGLIFRFYRLGDWLTGVHGDEGEAGTEALTIMEGRNTSMFGTGWFEQPNIYYYSIAAFMKVFGTDLFGVRMFAVAAGSLMMLPFYPLVRKWFGVRTAIIALTFMAISDVTIHFTRIQLSNITTPASLVIGFYFLIKGLKTRRSIDFVWSGFGFMSGLYFYNGGRLTPVLLVPVIAYIVFAVPLLRLPRVYGEIRALEPHLDRLRTFGKALWKQTLSVAHYAPQMLIFGIACVVSASPFMAYYFETANRARMDMRAGDKLIFNNEQRMIQRYGRNHEPLHVGLRWPKQDDIYPASPFVFEQTPLSVKVSNDGFWPRVIWDQTTTTLSILTYRPEACSFYTFTQEPIAKPIEAALIILGIAWATWRWRDTRMAMLSMWFWSAIFAGGVLTIDAPYMCRIIGMIPAMAIFAALPLSKLVAEFINMATRWGMSRVRWRFQMSHAVTSLGLVALLVYLGWQNWHDYYSRYLEGRGGYGQLELAPVPFSPVKEQGSGPVPFSEVTGQAYFVRQMNTAAQTEGKPPPRFFNLGVDLINWGHGANRFLNWNTPGQDMANPTQELPVLDSGNRDIYFMVWGRNRHYLDAIRSYYPEAKVEDFLYGLPGRGSYLFTYVHVKREHLDACRVSLATYAPASGPTIQREEPVLGSSLPPPDNLQYPVQASWRSNVVTPVFGRYKFSLDTSGEGALFVNGTRVLTTTSQVKHGEIELLLARGPQEVRAVGALANPDEKVKVGWASGAGKLETIPSHYLYGDQIRGLTGLLTSYVGDMRAPPGTQAQPGNAPVIQSARVDGFLGFRDAESVLGNSGQVAWTGTINIPVTGTYGFEAVTSSALTMFIDDTLVLDLAQGGGAQQVPGSLQLDAGPHRIEVRYLMNGTDYLELFWRPQGGQRVFLGPDVLNTDGGIIDPSTANEPPPVQLPPPERKTPERVFGGEGKLSNPRGLAVDANGNVYVGDRGNGRIVVYAPDRTEIRTWGKRAADSGPVGDGEFKDVSDIAIGADGTVYVMDQGTNRLQLFKPDGTFIRAVDGSVLQTSSANGIGLAPDGTLYIANSGRSNLLKVGPITDSNPTMTSIDGGEEMGKTEQPVDVAPDPSSPDRLYAVDLRDRVVLINTEGKITQQWRVPIGRDDGASRMAVSGDGKFVYVSDPDRNRVAILKLHDGSVTYFGGPGGSDGEFQGMSGIAVGPDGRLYVLDRRNNRVQSFVVDK